MAKKSESKKDKQEPKAQQQQVEHLQLPATPKRYDIVDPKRVLSALEQAGLPTDGSPAERADRLFSYYVHKSQKEEIGLADCQPDDVDDPLGCGFWSDENLDECPFCGKGGEVVAHPAAPPADRDIELDVVAAKTAKEKKKDGAVAKVSSRDVKQKKQTRGQKIDKPDEALKASIVPATAENVAIDLPSESTGGTAADLDRIAAEIDDATNKMLQNQAISMWEIGRYLTEIRDRKLWATVRNEADGGYVYANFNTFVASRFDFTPDHAGLMIRIAASMTKEAALIGSAKAKAILDAKLSDAITAELVQFASEKGEDGKFVHSLVELRLKIKNLKTPQLSTNGATTTNADRNEPDDKDRNGEDRDDGGDDDENDDSPPSRRSQTRNASATSTQMTSVSFESRTFAIPLIQKGSQVKPAKKIQDEPHGTLLVPGGAKIHFVLRIGDDGQLAIEGKIETPY